MKGLKVGMLAFLATTAMPAWAQDPPHPLLDAALRCRSIADDQARLRCFDAAITPIQQGITERRVLMVERREVRRSFFGLSIPRFLRGADEENEADAPRELQTTVQSASHTGYNMWLLTLQEGGTWQTIENSSRQDLPRPGAPVKIERSALGFYWISVNRRLALRARRIR